MRFFFCIFFCCSLFSNLVYSQTEVEKYSVQYFQYGNNPMLINPAFIGKSAGTGFFVTNQSLLGNFSKIRTYEANFHWRLKDRYGAKPFSVFGAYLENDQEGKYINRSRFYGLYAWHAKISSKLYFSGGIQIGGLNYSIKGTNSTGHASDFKPDASTGVSIYNNKFILSVAGYQLLKSRLQPMDEITVLSPYFNAYGQYFFKLAEEIEYSPGLLFWIPAKTNDYFFDINNTILLKEKFTACIGYRYNAGLIFSTGLRNLDYLGGNIGVGVTYHVPSKTNWLKINVLEFSMSYLLKN